MAVSTINIAVDDELAQFYNQASPEERQKIQAFFNVWLRGIAASDDITLGELMDEISEKAQARGLTPELLESLLNDEE